MNRKEFLKSIGVSAAFAITYSCLGGCSTAVDDIITEQPPLNGTLLTIDLTDASSSALKKNGGYLVKNNVLVAKDLNGNYVAATVVCSHENKKQIIFRGGEYFCTAHGARFNMQGVGLNADASKGLKVYNTSLNGNILTITI